MGYLVEGLELFIRKVAYTNYDATVLVRLSSYTRLHVATSQMKVVFTIGISSDKWCGEVICFFNMVENLQPGILYRR
jgi:hypothetical protein